MIAALVSNAELKIPASLAEMQSMVASIPRDMSRDVPLLHSHWGKLLLPQILAANIKCALTTGCHTSSPTVPHPNLVSTNSLLVDSEQVTKSIVLHAYGAKLSF